MLQTTANKESSLSPLATRIAAHPLAQHYGSLLNTVRGGTTLESNLRSTIGLTAIQVGAGATTVTLNLACRAACEGISVLVVDLDYARGDLARRLRGGRKAPGFIDYLQSRVDLVDCVQETDDENLHFLSGGQGSTLVAPDIARHVLAELADHYQLVLFDLPPVSDCGIWEAFARYFDATLLVLQADCEDRKELQKAQRRLTELGATITGAVWNKQPAE